MATSSRSRKARNLAARPTATLMVEARKPGSERGVTATGPVEIISGEKVHELNLRVHRRYLSAAAIADPQVGGVFAQFDDIALKLRPRVWTSGTCRSWTLCTLADVLAALRATSCPKSSEVRSHVEASVITGDIDAAPFHEDHGGLFRSFHKDGNGKYKLHAHAGAGDLTLR